MNMRLSISTGSLQKNQHPYYNRASFVLLLDRIRQTIETDWTQCIEETIAQIFSRLDHSAVGASFAQELLLAMHMVGIDERETLCNGLQTMAEEYDEGWDSGSDSDEDD